MACRWRLWAGSKLIRWQGHWAEWKVTCYWFWISCQIGKSQAPERWDMQSPHPRGMTASGHDGRGWPLECISLNWGQSLGARAVTQAFPLGIAKQLHCSICFYFPHFEIHKCSQISSCQVFGDHWYLSPSSLPRWGSTQTNVSITNTFTKHPLYLGTGLLLRTNRNEI